MPRMTDTGFGAFLRASLGSLPSSSEGPSPSSPVEPTSSSSSESAAGLARPLSGYQKRIMGAARGKNTVALLSTGAGKTRVAAGIIREKLCSQVRQDSCRRRSRQDQEEEHMGVRRSPSDLPGPEYCSGEAADWRDYEMSLLSVHRCTVSRG
eukprot:GHVU01061906.1.p2 GENE.GHVU01061906.1~~GHVU01061906.1.p2  ORF type:complete len:152 (-),score=11.71 GHVU01061906.1:1833-2288(-)